MRAGQALTRSRVARGAQVPRRGEVTLSVDHRHMPCGGNDSWSRAHLAEYLIPAGTHAWTVRLLPAAGARRAAPPAAAAARRARGRARCVGAPGRARACGRRRAARRGARRRRRARCHRRVRRGGCRSRVVCPALGAAAGCRDARRAAVALCARCACLFEGGGRVQLVREEGRDVSS